MKMPAVIKPIEMILAPRRPAKTFLASTGGFVRNAGTS